MGTLYVTEYATIAALPNHTGQVPLEPPLAEQKIVFAGSSVQSVAFQVGTRVVRVHTDAICSVLFGYSAAGGPTATTSSQRLIAGQTQDHGVPEGGQMQVAVIANT